MSSVTTATDDIADLMEQITYPRLARWISDFISPPIIAIAFLAMAVWYTNEPGTWRYAVLCGFVSIAMPAIYIAWLIKKGRVVDFHLPHRHERIRPFALTALSLAVALGILHKSHAPAPFIDAIEATFLLVVVLLFITFFWKISIHTSTLAGLITLAALCLGKEALFLAPLVVIVGWARVHLRRHTLAQTIAGVPVGISTLLYATAGTFW